MSHNIALIEAVCMDKLATLRKVLQIPTLLVAQERNDLDATDKGA